MVKPLFNIVVIKAEYYEVYAELGLLSCEHKIFIVMCRNEHCHCFFLPFCSWLWQYGFHFRSEATKLKGELEKLWFLCWFHRASDTTCDSVFRFKNSWHSSYTSGSVKGWFTQKNNDARKRAQVILTITTQIITELSQWNLFVFLLLHTYLN